MNSDQDLPDNSTTGEDLLAEPLDDADLDERLAAAGADGRAKSTTILAAVALVVVGIAVGAIAGAAITDLRHTLEAQAEEATFVPPPDAGAPDATGTIRAWDGNDVLLERADGSIVRVTVSDSTALQTVAPAQRDDLVPGTEVQVYGTFDPQGVLDAVALAQTPAR